MQQRHPAVGRTVVRGPATSSRAGETQRSVPVFSSSQARRPQRHPVHLGAGQDRNRIGVEGRTAAATSFRSPNTGTPTTPGSRRAAPGRRRRPQALVRVAAELGDEVATARSWPTATTLSGPLPDARSQWSRLRTAYRAPDPAGRSSACRRGGSPGKARGAAHTRTARAPRSGPVRHSAPGGTHPSPFRETATSNPPASHKADIHSTGRARLKAT